MRLMSSCIDSCLPVNLRNKAGLSGHVMGPPALFMHLIICSSTSSMQAKSIPFCTKSRTASAAFSTVGKEETATEVGRTG